jgi:hypothetical protein
MQITQADFRTVRIRKEGLSFFLRYSLYQDGEERFPESINCREDTVVAYFLTSTIRDFLRETTWGFAVERSWKIVPEGQFALSFCLDLPAAAASTMLLPAAAAAGEVTPEGLRATGWNTAYPNGLYLFLGPRSVLVFSDPLAGALGPGFVRGYRAVIDEEAVIRTEIRVPGEGDSAEPSRASRSGRGRVQPLPGYFPSPGNYEQSLRFNVAAAPTSAVFQRGIEAVVERLSHGLHPRRSLDGKTCRRLIEESIHHCLESHLVDQGGIYGLRTVPESTEISSPAGVAMARLLLTMFPNHEEMTETALRLADFALKGQHPGGLLYGNYFTNRKSWLEPDAGPNKPAEVRLDLVAETACSLLLLGETLRASGRPADRYLLAAERMGLALLASREDLAEIGSILHPDSLLSVAAGDGGISLIELYLRLYRLFGRDAYRKALSALVRRFYSEAPAAYAATLKNFAPAATAQTESEKMEANRLSFDSALRQAGAAVLLVEAGYHPKGLEEYLNRLLPWICLNLRPLPESLSMVGGVVGRLGDRRLRFRGVELALTILSLGQHLIDSPPRRLLKLLVPQLLGFDLQQPLGTAWLSIDERDQEPMGPIDSRLLVRELEALLRLQERFPEALGPWSDSQ